MKHLLLLCSALSAFSASAADLVNAPVIDELRDELPGSLYEGRDANLKERCQVATSYRYGNSKEHQLDFTSARITIRDLKTRKSPTFTLFADSAKSKVDRHRYNGATYSIDLNNGTGDESLEISHGAQGRDVHYFPVSGGVAACRDLKLIKE